MRWWQYACIGRKISPSKELVRSDETAWALLIDDAFKFRAFSADAMAADDTRQDDIFHYLTRVITADATSCTLDSWYAANA